MYVDDSGDPGKYTVGVSTNSKHFILSGLIVSQDDWMLCLDRLKTFRQHIKKDFGLNLKEEIHSNELIRVNKIEAYKKIKKKDRLNILRQFIAQLPIIFDKGKVINVCLDKTQFASTKDIQEIAWTRIIQRYDTFLKKTVSDKGIIISDFTTEPLIRNLIRKMRVYNPVPSHYGGSYNVPTVNIIEDPFLRDSKHSYFIQSVDAITQALYRREYPKGSLKKYGVQNYFNCLEPILLREAANNDKYGIVRK